MATITAAVLAAACAVALLGTLLTHWAVLRVSRAAPPPATIAPPLSVLKPVKGLDDGLYENLVSFAQQRHLRFEVLVGAATADDPALAVARQVQREFPDAPLSVHVCPRTPGLNPKVSTLETLSARARHDHLVISDSNVRVRPDYLSTLAAELHDPRVGLVTSVIAGVGERSCAALLENLHLASYVLRAIAAARVFLGHACVVGKSMLFRRSHLEALGGWAPVRDVLAEDYLLGLAFERAGWKVALCPHVVDTVNQRWTFGRFVNRHLRWGQMRRRVSIGAYLVEPLFNAVPLLLALAACAPALGEAWLRPLALAGVVARVASDGFLLRSLGRELPRGAWPLWIVAKDLLLAGLWVAAGFRRTVDWRGNLMRIGAGTRLEPIEPAVAPESPAPPGPAREAA